MPDNVENGAHGDKNAAPNAHELNKAGHCPQPRYRSALQQLWPHTLAVQLGQILLGS